MWKQVGEKVAIAVVAALVLGALTLLWNWASEGGVVRALGGVTVSELNDAIRSELEPLSNDLLQELRKGTEVIPKPGGNGHSEKCPDGSVMVGVLWQVDSGGPRGIISWISPVCRTLGI